MDEQAIMGMIGTVGFPIVAYLLMFLKMDKTIEKLEESINNNTSLIKLLFERENK